MRWSRLFPKPWRERYGDDIDELLDASERPVRDRLDIALTACGARWTLLRLAVTRHPRLATSARVAALVLIVVGSVGGVWANTGLAQGIIEIPGHWWSTLSIAPALVGAVLARLSWPTPGT